MGISYNFVELFSNVFLCQGLLLAISISFMELDVYFKLTGTVNHVGPLEVLI